MSQHTTTITRMFLHLFLNCSPFYRLRLSLVRGFYRRRDTFSAIRLFQSISKTNSQPIEGRANEKQVETHASYGCGSLGHNKITFRFDKSKYFNMANTSYLGSTAHQLLVAELGPRNSIPRDGEIQRILSVRGTSSNVPNNVEIGWLSFIKLSFFEIFSLRCRAAV